MFENCERQRQRRTPENGYTISSPMSLRLRWAKNIQKIFYKSFILPLNDYGCNTWSATTSSNIERISKLQKRAARIILQAEYLTPSSLMFDELGWLSIPRRLMYNKALLTFKALNKLTPAYISDLLKPMSETHSLSLRSSDNGLLSIPRSRSAHSTIALFLTLHRN